MYFVYEDIRCKFNASQRFISYILDDVERVESTEETGLPEHEKNDGLD
jgi:hypothetical protein